MTKIRKFFLYLTLIITFIVFGGIVLFSYIFPTIFNVNQSQSIDGSYKIKTYETVIDVKKDNTLEIKETIVAHFNTKKHGIQRFMSENLSTYYANEDGSIVSKNYKMKYKLIEASGDKYSTSSQNGHFVVKFGKENVLLNAETEKEYSLTYIVDMPNDRILQFDQFYYNILGCYWDTTIESFSAEINFFESVNEEYANSLCVYTGAYGSTEKLSTENFQWDEDKTSLKVIQTNIPANNGITVRIQFPNNYFQTVDYWWISLLLLVFIIGMGLIIFAIYKKFSNSKMIVPVVQFTLQKNFTSADVGYIIDKKVDNKDIASLLILWAQKGYVEIIEKKRKTFIKKIKEADDAMKPYEKVLFDKIFANSTEKMKIKSIGKKIASDIATIKSSVKTENQNSFNKTAENMRRLIIFLSGLTFAIVFIIVNYLTVEIIKLFVSLLVSFVIMFVLTSLAKNKDKEFFENSLGKVGKIILILLLFAVIILLAIWCFELYSDRLCSLFVLVAFIAFCFALIQNMNIRSDVGVRDLGDIIGLRNFINATEKDRLELLCKENPSMFYDVLPFAYVLGVYKKWCQKFEGIIIDTPTWYVSDRVDVFNSLLYLNLLDNSCGSFLQGIESARVSNIAKGVKGTIGGIGQSSGGGFSGGGFGGGGGSSW